MSRSVGIGYKQYKSSSSSEGSDEFEMTIVDETDQEVILYKPKKKTKKGKAKDNRSASESNRHEESKKKKSSKPSKKKNRTDSTRKSRNRKERSPSLDGNISMDLSELTHKTVPTSNSDTSLCLFSTQQHHQDMDPNDLEQPSAPTRATSVIMYQQNKDQPGRRDTTASSGNSRALDTTTTNEIKMNGGGSSSRRIVSYSDQLTYRLRSALKQLLHFRVLKIIQVVCAIYICIMTLKGGLLDPQTGVVIDKQSDERTSRGVILVNGTERAIVGEDDFQVISILIARLSAWFMYPTLVMVYFSKFRATGSFLSRSPLAIYLYSDSHELHVYCGWTILVCSLVHAIFHLARWAAQGNISLLWTHFSGITGLIIISSCLLICFPMTIFRKYIKFEIRKVLHYLFIAFGLALCFHTPTSAVPNGGFSAYVFGTLLTWYFLDASYCYFFMTEKIDTTQFSVLPSGVRVTMTVSERFQKMGDQGGIGYVCLPWISKNQWHAFSLFENPSNPSERQIFISKCGDWTTAVHRALQRETVRPCYINGPFPSPYNNADAYDNQILVASGIGITPALSVIRAHKNTRRINLIWAVRDESLLQFFLQHLYLDHQGWNLIFYTGKEKIRDPTIHARTKNTNICIIQGRPKLSDVVPNIIYGIESGLGLPERYNPDTKLVASEMIADRYRRASQMTSPTTSDSIHLAEDLACYASELGFHLPTEKVDAISQEFALQELNHSIDYQRQFDDGLCPGSHDLDASARTTAGTIMNHLAVGFQPWDDQDGARSYVKNLDKNLILPTWGMLYCGGSKVVEEELKKLSDEYRIGLHVESFAW